MNILLVGPGLIGQKHARLIEQHPNIKLEAIVTAHPEKHKDLAEKYNTKLFKTIEEALKIKKIDAAVISTPNEYHYEHTMACFKYKIPVLLEKPITVHLSKAKKLVEYSEKKNIVFLVGDHRLYNPLLRKAKKFIDSKKSFGELVSFLGSAQFYKPQSYFEAGKWRMKKGGGPILINLVHEIGIMRLLCGEIKKVSAFASHKIRNFEVEDTVSVSIEFENGAIGSFLLSDTAVSNKSWEMTTGENPAYPHHNKEWTYHIAGTKASLDFPNMRTRSYVESVEPSWWVDFENSKIDIKHEDPLQIQLEHFYKVVTEGITPISPARNAYMNMLVIEMVKESIEKEKVVYLAEIKGEIENE